jgi:hypothetical protein
MFVEMVALKGSELYAANFAAAMYNPHPEASIADVYGTTLDKNLFLVKNNVSNAPVKYITNDAANMLDKAGCGMFNPPVSTHVIYITLFDTGLSNLNFILCKFKNKRLEMNRDL